MKALSLLGLVVFATLLTACLSGRPSDMPLTLSESPTAPDNAKHPVLVELFTSEGCSSCPPADRLLVELNRDQKVDGAEVIALGYHVDYWDGIGWRDRFASREYTKRQEAYAAKLKEDGTYTPQMIVNGVKGFVGSNRGLAFDSIAAGAKTQTGSIALAIKDGKLSAKITGVPVHSDATVYLAVAEDDLKTNVKGGENSGESLQHAAIVRTLGQIGLLSVNNNESSIEAPIPSDTSWKTGKLRYVVFVQENSTLKVLAVDQIKP